jgi:hypothetical protein
MVPGVYAQVWGDADVGGPIVAVLTAFAVLQIFYGARKLLALRRRLPPP